MMLFQHIVKHKINREGICANEKEDYHCSRQPFFTFKKNEESNDD